MKYKNIFVTGCDIGVGKTIVSSILVSAFSCDYWKPIQCGTDEATDSITVRALVEESKIIIHPESYVLDLPKSPHLAAYKQNVRINLSKIILPSTNYRLIVEGAGGVLVPLNDRDYVIDIAIKEKMPVIFVSKNYLGSLNHTFLSIEALRSRGLLVVGLVFNGDSDPELETFVANKCDLPILFRISNFPHLDKRTISKVASELKRELENML